MLATPLGHGIPPPSLKLNGLHTLAGQYFWHRPCSEAASTSESICPCHNKAWTRDPPSANGPITQTSRNLKEERVRTGQRHSSESAIGSQGIRTKRPASTRQRNMISQNEASNQANIQDYLQNGGSQPETESARTGSSFPAPLREVLEHDQMIANPIPTAFIRSRTRTGSQVNVAGAGLAMGRRKSDPLDVFVYADITIIFSAMEVRRSGQLIPLTLKEFNTLVYLLKNTPRVISRDELLNEVWGYESYPCTRTVDNHILRLRKKLEPESGCSKHLRTVHGIGYRFLP
jgi:hypothetical protein